MQYEDFSEIAPCGGHINFNIRCDQENHRTFAIGFAFNSPRPATIVGIYGDLLTGSPVGDFMMGGIGQGFDPPMPDRCVPVFVGCDTTSMWGHRCPRCQTHFRSEHHPSRWPLTCPYCYLIAGAFNFLTERHHRYFEHYVDVLNEALGAPMEPGTEQQIVIDMDALVDLDASVERPDFYYVAEAQQTIFTCDRCGSRTDIRGRFGNCSQCGARNNRSRTADALDELRGRLNAANVSPADTVRTAISLFDASSRDIASRFADRIPMLPARKSELQRALFHDIDGQIISDMKLRYDVDFLRGMDGDMGFLRLMFARRHVYEHADGVADARYLQQSGDTSVRDGDLIRETQESANRLIGLLTRIVGNADRDFHAVFVPTEIPVRLHQDDLKRRGEAQRR